MDIEVKGHSGCTIDVVREADGLYLYKCTRDPGYLDRLQLQARKQQEAARLELQHIRVPRICDVQRTEQEVRVKMEYVYSKNFVGYFERAGFEQIAYFSKALQLFLDYEVEHSPLQTVGREVLQVKFDDVRRRTLANTALQGDAGVSELMEQSARHFGRAEDMLLPVGQCHGDLTFSNILFNGNNYYLIDFLDSFIESPLLDIVKLRQDSCFLWSQLMYGGNCDGIRLRIVADRLDRDIVDYASRYEWYRHYPLLQLMNFLRVLQYAHEERVIQYLKNVINRLLHEL